MKKILIATNVLLASFIIFQACNSVKDPKHLPQPDNRPPQVSYCADTSCYASAVGALNGMISYATAKRICDNYGGDIHKKMIYLGGVDTKKEDSRSVWLDLQKLKSFIALIEKNACIAGCNNKTTQFGVRVYFAKYPSAAEIAATDDLKDGVRAAYENHTTVFLSPTFYDATKKRHVDFDPRAIRANCGLFPIDPIKGEVWALTAAGAGATPPGGDQQNHGDLKPPPDGAGAFPVQ